MKLLSAILNNALRSRSSRRNLILISWFLFGLIFMISTYSTLFQFLMLREGREYSWVTGFYWTLTTMSTLGFGDITFQTDLGRFFSIVVLLSGVVSLLIVLPFTFIEFFYEPWMRAHSASRVPRELPKETRDHIVLTHYDVVTQALINKLKQYNYSYVLIIEDLTEALRLYDLGLQVVLGDLNDSETYKKVHVEKAALVATTCNSMVNTSVAFAVRSISSTVPIVSTSESATAMGILKQVGSTHVLPLDKMMGKFLARRTNGGDAMSHKVGEFGQLCIAEATPASVMVDKKIRDIGLREKVGVTVLGVWERGQFNVAHADTVITQSTILVIAGSKGQLEKYDALFCIYNVAMGPVIIVGGGPIGRSASRAFEKRDLDYRIIEKNPDRIRNQEKYILGDASKEKILRQAGVMNSPAIVITTNNSAFNLYLTIFVRHLRSDIQIVSRAGLESNVMGLHQAGTDFVMSYASMGANAILNILKRGDILMVAEGLDIFKVTIPPSFVGKSIEQLAIRQKTGCSVVAMNLNGTSQILPDPKQPFPEKAEVILIGNEEAENRFFDLFGSQKIQI